MAFDYYYQQMPSLSKKPTGHIAVSEAEKIWFGIA